MLARRPILDRPPVQNFLVLVALAISLFMLAPPYSPVLSRTRYVSFLRGVRSKSAQTLSVGPLPQDAKPRRRRPPVNAKGIIMTGYTAGGPRFESLLGLIERTEI